MTQKESEEWWNEEREKCKDPVYFYNTYYQVNEKPSKQLREHEKIFLRNQCLAYSGKRPVVIDRKTNCIFIDFREPYINHQRIASNFRRKLKITNK